jgi:hypothetical protein
MQTPGPAQNYLLNSLCVTRYEDLDALQLLSSVTRVVSHQTAASLTIEESWILGVVLFSRSDRLRVEPKNEFTRTQLAARPVHLLAYHMLPFYQAGCTTMPVLM